MSKPTLCLDFDGVLHSYTSGWIVADFIPDPPVPGAFDFLFSALDHFEVVIFSSRSHAPGGIRAMSQWLFYWAGKWSEEKGGTLQERKERANKVINYFNYDKGPTNNLDETRKTRWPTVKPSAFITIDDRALTFTGSWPDMQTLLDFKPWFKK